MQTSRFQLTLNTIVSAGFGAALLAAVHAGSAVGYPAGAAVSLGTNPVASFAGTMSISDSESLVVVPEDQALIITDVVLSMGDSGNQCRASTQVEVTASGSDLGHFGVGVSNETRTYTSWDPTLVASLRSGLRVGPGDTLEITSSQKHQYNCSSPGPELHFTLSGYYAQP